MFEIKISKNLEKVGNPKEQDIRKSRKWEEVGNPKKKVGSQKKSRKSDKVGNLNKYKGRKCRICEIVRSWKCSKQERV